MRAAVPLLVATFAVAAHAQDLSILAGSMKSAERGDRTFALGFEYSHDLGEHIAASVDYRNEGHIPGHHRDGQAAMLWLRARPVVPELTLAAGGGPYYYFDTTVAETGSAEAFNNAHGWGWLYGASATWRPPGSRWSWQLRLERTETPHNIDTTLLMAAVGYRLDQDSSFRASAPEWERRHDDEIFAALGQTIVNSFESQSAGAGTVEYRHAFGPVIRGSIGWVHEGDARLIRRDGVVAEGWLEPSFSGGRYTLGIGLGGYFAVDEYRPGSKELQGLVTMTSSLRLANHWVGRFLWHRVATRHSRDSDVVVLGAGYRF